MYMDLTWIKCTVTAVLLYYRNKAGWMHELTYEKCTMTSNWDLYLNHTKIIAKNNLLSYPGAFAWICLCFECIWTNISKRHSQEALMSLKQASSLLIFFISVSISGCRDALWKNIWSFYHLYLWLGFKKRMIGLVSPPTSQWRGRNKQFHSEGLSCCANVGHSLLL